MSSGLSFLICTRLEPALVVVAACLLGGCIHVAPEPIEPDQIAQYSRDRSLEDPSLQSFLHEHLGPEIHLADGSWTFEALSWVAFHERADLAVARSQWRAAKASHQSTSERPNPTVSFNPGYNSNSGRQSPWFPSLDFDIPLTGRTKRAADQARSAHEVEVRRQDIATAAWQVRSQLWQALVSWSAAQRRASTLANLAQRDEEILALWTQRKVVGAAAAGDAEVIAAQLANTRSQADANLAAQVVHTARQAAASALGLPVSALATTKLPDVLPAASPSAAPRAGNRASLQQAALRERSEIRAALSLYAAAQSALEFEVARQYPDIHLGPGYQWDQGASKWSLVGTMEWPIFSRNRAAIETALAEREVARSQFEAVQAQVLAEIERAATAFDAALAQSVATTAARNAEHIQIQRLQAQLQAGLVDRLTLATALRAAASIELAEIDTAAARAAAEGDLAAALQLPFKHSESLFPASPQPPLPSSP